MCRQVIASYLPAGFLERGEKNVAPLGNHADEIKETEIP